MDQNKTSANAAATENTSASKAKSTNRTIQDNDIVVVKSLVPNVYYTCTKTMDSFNWADAGDTQEMTFAQLKILKNKHGGYFTKKWLYPESKSARKKLGIEALFAVKFEKKDMKLLYGDDVDAVKAKIAYIPAEDKSTYVDKIKDGVEQGKITNVKIIRLLEKEFDIELMDLV